MKWSKGRVRAPILTGFHECAPQDIAAKDAEKARAEVQATAAAKAADKLRKEGVKGEAERQRLAAELEGLKAKFQVGEGRASQEVLHGDQSKAGGHAVTKIGILTRMLISCMSSLSGTVMIVCGRFGRCQNLSLYSQCRARPRNCR